MDGGRTRADEVGLAAAALVLLKHPLGQMLPPEMGSHPSSRTSRSQRRRRLRLKQVVQQRAGRTCALSAPSRSSTGP